MEEPYARALLAGTLALMTVYAEHRCPSASAQIRDNLLRLSALPELPWEFRAAVAKLHVRWSQLSPVETGTLH